MLQRFSFFSKIPYDTSLIQRVTSGQNNNVQDILRAQVQSNVLSADIVSQSNFYAGRMVADSNFESANIITDSIGKSTESLSSKLDHVALSQIFGSLMSVGAIAISTAILTKKINEVSQGVQRLGSMFSEGMALISSQLDIQTNSLVEIRDQLGKIYETLKSPLITQASEWQRIGLERFSTGLIPEAKDAFQKAVDLDTTDPVSNMMLGKIYLDGIDKGYNFHNLFSANEYFNKSIRYSEATLSKAPKLKDIYEESLYFSSTTLLALASQHSDSNGNNSQQIKEALNQIEKLLTSNPEHIQGRYYRAKLLLILGKDEDAVKEIFILLDKNLDLISLPLADEDFTKYSHLGLSVIKKLKNYYLYKLKLKLENLHLLIDKLKELNCEVPRELIDWLDHSKLNPLELGLKKLDSIPFDELSNNDKSMHTIFEIGIQGLLNIQKLELSNKFLSLKKSDLYNRYYYLSEEILYYSDFEEICQTTKAGFNDLLQNFSTELETVDEYSIKLSKLAQLEKNIDDLTKSAKENIELFNQFVLLNWDEISSIRRKGELNMFLSTGSSKAEKMNKLLESLEAYLIQKGKNKAFIAKAKKRLLKQYLNIS